jgi:cell division protein FtsL
VKEKTKKESNILPILFIAVILTLALNLYNYYQIDSLNKQIASISAERESLKTQVTDLSAQGKDLKSSLETMTSEKNLLADQFNGAVTEKKQLLDRIDKLNADAVDYKKNINDLNAQLKIVQGTNVGDNSFAENLPRVELFVMSQCPYGTQVEKAILPAVRLLGDRIKFSVRFCNYAMHGKIEVDEELTQYCIQKEENNKYLDYLTCFLHDGNGEFCLKNESINMALLKSCMAETDNTYKVSESYNNTSQWFLQKFPQINMDKGLNDRYGVKSSPTLVVNGKIVETYDRNPAGLLSAVCAGFKDRPKDCGKSLPPWTPSLGFGYTYQDGSSMGSCGG